MLKPWVRILAAVIVVTSATAAGFIADPVAAVGPREPTLEERIVAIQQALAGTAGAGLHQQVQELRDTVNFYEPLMYQRLQSIQLDLQQQVDDLRFEINDLHFEMERKLNSVQFTLDRIWLSLVLP